MRRSEKIRPVRAQRLLFELRKARLSSADDVPGGHRMLRHLLAAARRQRCDQPDQIGSVPTRRKLRARLVWIAVGASARSASVAWSSPEWVVATSLCQRVGRYPPPHRIFQFYFIIVNSALKRIIIYFYPLCGRCFARGYSLTRVSFERPVMQAPEYDLEMIPHGVIILKPAPSAVFSGPVL